MKNIIVNVAVILLLALVCSACMSNDDGQTNDQANDSPSNDSSTEDNTSDSTYKVVIDAGHGGKDVGATGVSGKYEKSFTLSLALKVKELLEQDPDVEVHMTRTDDTHLSQESRYRPKFANDLNADVFVSIHGNTFSDPNVSGTETYYYHRNSKSLATIIHDHVVEATGFKNRGVKKEDFFVVKDTEMPAVLLELGYLTNPSNESEMLTEEFQNRVASAIVEGLKEYRE